MPYVTAPDGTTLAYSVVGQGEPLLCLAGGPMRDATYLGDLGGLSRHRTLVLLDLRGTGRSGSADPDTYRCDRLVGDVEAVRDHLGLATVDVLAHSAGANLALRHLEAHPDAVGTLTLVTPSTRAVGLATTDEERLAAVAGRAEAWLPEAVAAFRAVLAGTATDDDERLAGRLSYAAWTQRERDHHDAQTDQLHPDAAAAFGADGAFDPPATRAALARHPRPVTVLAGDVDPLTPAAVVGQLTALAPSATLQVLARSGHYPWVDDPDAFVAAVTARWSAG